MGLRKKLGLGGPGIGGSDGSSDRVLRDIRARQRQGLGEFMVTVSEGDIGFTRNLDAHVARLVGQIQAAGHIVLDVSSQGDWSGVRNIRVKPAAPTSASEGVESRASEAPPNRPASAQALYMAKRPADINIDEALDFVNYALRIQSPPVMAVARGWVCEPGRVEVAVVVPETCDPLVYPGTDEGREVERHVNTHEVWQHADIAPCGPVAVVWFHADGFAAVAHAWSLVHPT